MNVNGYFNTPCIRPVGGNVYRLDSMKALKLESMSAMN
jgi:hypothetical protein